jgi:hypothetical protein
MARKKSAGFDWSTFDVSQPVDLADADFIKAVEKLDRSQATVMPVRSVSMTVEAWEWEAANLRSPYEDESEAFTTATQIRTSGTFIDDQIRRPIAAYITAWDVRGLLPEPKLVVVPGTDSVLLLIFVRDYQIVELRAVFEAWNPDARIFFQDEDGRRIACVRLPRVQVGQAAGS